MLIKILLTTLNARYIHSSAALYYLRGFCREYENISIEEFSINNSRGYILRRIYEYAPEVICFSCYIWNIEMIINIVDTLKKISPRLTVVLGGPEVSYDPEETLKRCPADFVISGEGEESYKELLGYLLTGNQNFEEIRGLTYRQDGEIFSTSQGLVMDLNRTVFPYSEGFENFKNRIIYYETSRGCPFSCKYCLSSDTTGVRFLAMERVYEELNFFLRHKVKQVKLVDRTFNCDKKRAFDIWKYLIDHDNGLTNFHFEIAGDLLDGETLSLLAQARQGQFQFEIGVQSVNRDTLNQVSRRSDLPTLFENVRQLKRQKNIHIHLDLIAGLPGESLSSFAQSFNQVYALESDQLQLGFLKVLKGSAVRDEAKEHGIAYGSSPPYEVLFTNHISYEEIAFLQLVEEMTELFYNSEKFHFSLRYMLRFFPSAFELYGALAVYWKDNGYHINEASYQKPQLYEIMHDFCSRYEKTEVITDLLKLDLLRNHNEGSPPLWLVKPHTGEEKLLIRHFYNDEQNLKRYFSEFSGYGVKEIFRMSRIEGFEWSAADYAEGKSMGVANKKHYVLFKYLPGSINKKAVFHAIELKGE